jgi:hypothetical protein
VSYGLQTWVQKRHSQLISHKGNERGEEKKEKENGAHREKISSEVIDFEGGESRNFF